MSVAGLSNQIRLMCRMVKRDLSTDPATNDELVAKLAQWLDDAGTQSILNLAYYEDAGYGVSFFYDTHTAHVFESDFVNTAAFNQGMNGGNLFVRFNTHDGREQDNIYCFFTKDGYPVFWNISSDNGATWADIRGGLIFVGSVVLSVVGVPIATSIGNAVMGAELAASYPALANGIGQTVLNTLLNGGDIEKGATSAVASYVGAGVGGQVTSLTNVDAIGQAAAAATRAYITGGDITTAVGQSFLRNGVSSMQSLLLSGVGDAGDFTDYDPSIDWGTDVTFDSTDYGNYSTGAPSMSYYTDENGITYGMDAQGDLTVIDYVDDAGIGYYTDAQGDVLVADAPTTADLSQTDNNGTDVFTSSSGGGGGGGFNPGVLTSLASTALQLVNAYVHAGQPAVRTGNAAATVNANGTITTRNANGTTTVTRPAPGTPYITSGGSVVTNNGDGTYTTINSNGAVSTLPYSTTPGNLTGALGANGALYIGLAVLGAIALTQRR